MIKAIVLCLKLVGEVRGIPLAYMVIEHEKVVHISPGYRAFLNLDKEMFARS